MSDNVIDIDLDMDIENSTPYDGIQITTTTATSTDSTNTEENNTAYANLDTRPEAIYLLGLDNMSTKDINDYCENTGLKKVEWIDDSSCVLVFENEEEAKKAGQQLVSEPSILSNNVQLTTTTLLKAKPFIRANYKNQSKGEEKDNETGGEGKEQEKEKEGDDEDEEMDITRPPLIPIIDQLQIRMATDRDVKTRGARERSRYYLFHGVDDSGVKKKNDHHNKNNRHHPYSRNQHRHHHQQQYDNDKYSNIKRHQRRSRRRSASPNPRTRKVDDDKPIVIPEHLRARLGKLN
ncbi:hypothetical protein BJ944DRAFT_268563 [Cunninghamella echinulata]|nr:hypothetical protein BJ944DRAFT_268563 [Cunninghamella echinulata]